MIGQLKGIVEQIDVQQVLLDVNGVGYVVQASSRTLATLSTGTPALLHIETHVREDAITLYGFANKAEQTLFRLLTTVQGVGPKAGLALLSALSAAELQQAIMLDDSKLLTRADGVGAKLAARITHELKNKISAAAGIAAGIEMNKTGASIVANLPNSAANDAVLALLQLGYKRADAVQVVTTITASGALPVDKIITLALKELAA